MDLFFSGDKGQLSSKGRANIEILLDNTTIIPFRWKNLFICFYCGKHTNEASEIREHAENHAKSGTIKTTEILSKLRGSDKCVKLDVSNLTCKLCKVNFLAVDDIVDHLIQDHDLEYQKEVFMYMRQYNLSKSKCPECSESFLYASFLIKHVDETHNLWTFPCDKCSHEFSAEEYLETHISEVHRIRDKNSKIKEINTIIKDISTIVNMSNVTPFKGCRSNRYFDCYSCSNTFDDFKELCNHHASNHIPFSMQPDKLIVLKVDTADLACRECSDYFTDVQNLIDHLRLKHDVGICDGALECIQQFEIAESYSCRLCNASFDKYSLLARHISAHHAPRPVLCQHCGLGFNSFSCYNKHSKRCTGNETDTNEDTHETVYNSEDHYKMWLKNKGIDVAAKKTGNDVGVKRKKLEVAQKNDKTNILKTSAKAKKANSSRKRRK